MRKLEAPPNTEVWEARVVICTECGAELPDTDEADRCWRAGTDLFACEGMLVPSEPARDAWWWWTCSPGCLPDSDVFGPFDTEEEAIEDARDEDEDEEDDDEE